METITKKIAVPLCLIFITLFHFSGISQSADCIDNHSGTVASGTIDEYCEGTLKSNTTSSVSFEINSNVKYRSASQIHLYPGFHAGNFATTNKFHAQIDNLTVLEPTNGVYEQLEKMEWAITIPNMNISRYNYDANWSNQTLLTNLDLNEDISDFFDQTTYPNPYTNPYDPDDIDIEVTFKHESGQTFKTWGFYYRGFEYDNDGSASMEDLPESWVPVTNDFGWRVRFAPPLTGNYTSCIKITTYRNTAHKTVYENCNNTPFNVVTSDNPGYLVFANGAKHLSFSKQPGANTFFPIGNNLVSDFDDNKYTSYPAEYYFNRKYVENLSGRGNYARLTFNVNGYWIEYDEPGNYDAHQKTMWELDSLVYTAEQNDVYLLFSLMIYEELYTGTGVADYLNSDGRLNTRDFLGGHPYKKPYQLGDATKLDGVIGTTTPLTDFFTVGLVNDTDSEKLLKNRYRYIISRWGYSTNVSAYDLLGEIDNLLIKNQVTSTSNGLVIERIFNIEAEEGLEALAKSWTGKMAGFLKLNDPNHLTTICTLGNEAWFDEGVNHVFNADNLDYVSFDEYGGRRNHNILNRASHVEEVLENAVYNDYNNPNTMHETNTFLRPVELLEMGSHDLNIAELYTPSNVHNAFWSSSFMGAIGSGSYFYKHYISDIGLKKAENAASGIYDATREFTEPGQTSPIQHKAKDNFWPCWYPISDGNCSVRQDLSGNLIGSVGSTSYITPDFTHHLKTLKEFMNVILPANNVNLQDNYIPQRFPTTNITNRSYENGNELECFMLKDDNNNKVVGWVHNRSSYWGNLDFIAAYNDRNGCTDFINKPGFQAIGDPVYSYKYDGGTNIDVQDDYESDILEYNSISGMPSFQITGLDNNREYTVQWYHTLGETPWSPPGSPTTSANTSSGVLTVTPPDMTNAGDHDYAFIITGGGFNERKGRTIESGGNSSLQLTPNPSKGIFNLSLTENTGGEVQVINSVGDLVYQKTITATNTLVIDLSHEPKGVYYIKVITESGVKVEKIIKN